MTPLTVGPLELASMLYRLSFPKRDFWTLPESVQLAYRSDATRLLTMLHGAESGAAAELVAKQTEARS